MQINALTIKHDGFAHRIITDAEISAAYNPTIPPQNLPPKKKFKALWDTGSTGTVISENVVKQLRLVLTGKCWVQYGVGRKKRNTYIINVYLPSSVVVIGVQATDYPTIIGHDIIIGMNIITQGDFSITNLNNQTWMSFRIPSLNATDYVQELNRIRYTKVGRNDPCPCGKTNERGAPIKFKKCHWTEYR